MHCRYKAAFVDAFQKRPLCPLSVDLQHNDHSSPSLLLRPVQLEVNSVFVFLPLLLKGGKGPPSKSGAVVKAWPEEIYARQHKLDICLETDTVLIGFD